MRQKSNSTPVTSEKLVRPSDGQPGSNIRPKRRSALFSMARAAKPQLPGFAGAKASPRACITPGRRSSSRLASAGLLGTRHGPAHAGASSFSTAV
jgi:hypothetical protein